MLLMLGTPEQIMKWVDGALLADTPPVQLVAG
jgi:hypothetical protein